MSFDVSQLGRPMPRWNPGPSPHELAALQLEIDNARAFLRGEIEGEPLAGTLAHEVWTEIYESTMNGTGHDTFVARYGDGQ